MARERTITTLLRTAVIIGILVCLTAAVGAGVADAAGETGTVSASSGLNLRSEPNTSSSVLAVAPRGATVQIVETLDGWYKVTYQGRTGYMNKEYLSVAGGSSSSGSSASGTGYVKGTYVNVRSGPGLNYSVVGSTNTGESYTVSAKSGDWYKITYKGVTAYINSSYLSLGSGSSSSGGSTSAPETQSGTQTTGVITGSYVNLRSGPSTSYASLGTYNNGTKMTITGQSGDWYAVTYNGVKGYVYKQYLSTSGTSVSVESMTNTPAVTTTAVNMREGPSTAYTSKQVLAAGAAVTLTGKSGQWYRVTYGNDSGFILGTYISTNTASGNNSAGTPSAQSTDAGEKIVVEAKKYLGVPYVYGGTSPSGFDCSGFVYYVYKQCGYSISRTATAQNSNGTQVSRGDMQPGDIIIFYHGYKSAIGHAGLYIGNNQFIHASSGGGKVMISNLSETYYNTRFYSARRVVQ